MIPQHTKKRCSPISPKEELYSALGAIHPADLDYGAWLAVGMALKESGADVSVWEEWSARDGGRFHPGECARKWAGFAGSVRPVTQNTIFKMAYERGWQGPGFREDGAIGWDDAICTGWERSRSDSAGASSGAPGSYDAAANTPLLLTNANELQPFIIPEQWDPVRQLIDYLEALFEPADNVGYVVQCFQRDGEWKPTKGCWDRTAGQLIEALTQCGGDIGAVLGDYNQEAGAWIRFNPLDGQGCKNDNVSDFRYALVESDEGELAQQNAVIHDLELPCAALVYSGGKSLHAIVRVDAPDHAEYKRRVDYLYAVCRKNGLVLDPQCRNPSRLSRMPGAMRGGKKQYLLETNFGKKSWAEWRDWIEAADDDLPDADNMADVWENLPALAPPLIGGVLRQGHKLLLAGPSKAGKSFALIELCIAIAEGIPWLGRFSCARGRVLYVNLELDRASCLHRFADVYAALGVPPAGIRNIDVWNLRGASVPMDKLTPKLIRRARRKNYIAVVLDPIYKVITGDENSADQMARFCNQFDLVCRELGSATIYCHHHSKGLQGQKRSMDRASGSGVFARDPDAMLDLIELTPTEAVRDQLKQRAACAVCKSFLDARGYAEAYGPDEALSGARMMDICKEHLGAADLRALYAAITDAEEKALKRTAWRIEGTLREFERFEPVNLWFDYPVHRLDDALLTDLEPENDFRVVGAAGAKARWQKTTPEERVKKKQMELDNAFEISKQDDGTVTVDSMAQYLSVTPKTLKARLNKDKRFLTDGKEVVRKASAASESSST